MSLFKAMLAGLEAVDKALVREERKMVTEIQYHERHLDWRRCPICGQHGLETDFTLGDEECDECASGITEADGREVDRDVA